MKCSLMIGINDNGELASQMKLSNANLFDLSLLLSSLEISKSKLLEKIKMNIQEQELK